MFVVRSVSRRTSAACGSRSSSYDSRGSDRSAPTHPGQLPREIGGVLHAGRDALTTGRAVDVCRIAREKYPTIVHPVDHPTVDAELRKPPWFADDRGIQPGCALCHEAAHRVKRDAIGPAIALARDSTNSRQVYGAGSGSAARLPCGCSQTWFSACANAPVRHTSAMMKASGSTSHGRRSPLASGPRCEHLHN